MSSREKFGSGGLLGPGVSFTSQQLALLGWSMDQTGRFSDNRGTFAVNFVLKSPAGIVYRTIMTARERQDRSRWSVTMDIGGAALNHDAWLFGYFDRPFQHVLVFDPNRYTETSTARGGTLEFDVGDGVDLTEWLTIPSMRFLRKRLR